MAYEKRPGDGTLFINDKKTQDKHPDRKGDALIHCPSCNCNFEAWLSGWIKKGQKGQFLSLSIKAKDDPGASPQAKQQRAQPQTQPQDDEADIPF